MADIKEVTKPKSQMSTTADQGSNVAASSTQGGQPMTLIGRFAEEMDRLFDDFGVRMPSFFGRGRDLMLRDPGLIPPVWAPRIDVHQREGQIQVCADLPGMSKDDIHVDLTDDRLTIRGERKQEKSETREGGSYCECSYGSFFRSIPLPEGIDKSKATAEFRNGVLEIAIPTPSKPEAASRRLEIQEKK